MEPSSGCQHQAVGQTGKGKVARAGTFPKLLGSVSAGNRNPVVYRNDFRGFTHGIQFSIHKLIGKPVPDAKGGHFRQDDGWCEAALGGFHRFPGPRRQSTAFDHLGPRERINSENQADQPL